MPRLTLRPRICRGPPAPSSRTQRPPCRRIPRLTGPEAHPTPPPPGARLNAASTPSSEPPRPLALLFALAAPTATRPLRRPPRRCPASSCRRSAPTSSTSSTPASPATSASRTRYAAPLGACSRLSSPPCGSPLCRLASRAPWRRGRAHRAPVLLELVLRGLKAQRQSLSPPLPSSRLSSAALASPLCSPLLSPRSSLRSTSTLARCLPRPRGARAAPSRVSLVSRAVERTVRARVPLATCAEVGACSRRPSRGASGTGR